MKSTTLLISSILAAAVSAQPKHLPHMALHEKRDMYTEFDYTTEVTYFTTTVWLNPGDSAPSATASAQPVQSVSVSSAVKVAEAAKTTPTISSATLSSSSVASVEEKAVEQPTKPIPTTMVTSSYSAPEVASTTTSAASQAEPSSSSGASASVGVSIGGAYGSFVTPSDKTDFSSQCAPGSPCNGEITFFTLSDGMACGYPGLQGTDSSSLVIALPYQLMGTSSNSGTNAPTNANCNRKATVSCPQSGKSVTVTVVDKCMSCDGYHIDLSEGAFNALGLDSTQGTGSVNWNFNAS